MIKIRVPILVKTRELIAALRAKKRVGLRSPRRTKKALRWAIQHRNKIAYLLVLSWLRIVAAALAVWGVFYLPPRADVNPWLFRTQLAMSAILALMYVVDATLGPARRWERRYSTGKSTGK
jgi:hypothetical protein